MKCPYCNHLVSRKSKYCQNCYKSLREHRRNIVKCRNCGAENYQDSKYCHNCSSLIGKYVEKESSPLINIIRFLGTNILKMMIFISIIIGINLIGIVTYDAINHTNHLNKLSLLLLVEGGIIMFIGARGATAHPQVAIMKTPYLWSKTVPVAKRELLTVYHRQSSFWIFAGIGGFIIFFLGLFLI